MRRRGSSRARRPAAARLLAAVLALGTAGLAAAADPSAGAASSAIPAELKKLSLEELMNTEVTSLSKKAEPRSEAAAAVHVITGDEIRRSGVTTIPEALRLAPGVHVARIDANKWAIGVRGFASRLSRSMLGLMDGRSLYTPLFAGVYWEVQDTLLEDVDRIEVIRGPGGTLWGANAVNGVINIITKSAEDTQGALVTGGGGTEERGFGAVRYGGTLGEAIHYRVYAKYADRAGQFDAIDPDFDDWRMGQVGFRTDTRLPGGDRLTVQGDLYDGSAGQRSLRTVFAPPFQETSFQDTDLSGGNVLGRWTHVLGEGSDVVLQAYYDRTFRREANFQDSRNTGDLDLQHRFRLPLRQEVVWGLGYRVLADETRSTPAITFVPASRRDQLWSGFLQDEIQLVPDRLRLTIGTKAERNESTGFELQPSGRLLWTPADRHVVWASITRAVRTPSRVERDLTIEGILDPSTGTFGQVTGDGRFRTEKVLAYELGYRYEPMPRLFLDLAAFYNRYTDLISFEPGTPFQDDGPPRPVLPFFLRNRLDGQVYGFELSADAAPVDGWRLAATYSFLDLSLDPDGSQDPTFRSTERSSPQNQVSLRSSLDLPLELELDGWLRWVDTIPGQGVSSYVSLDLRLAWHPTPSLEVAAVGQNLLEKHHAEFGGDGSGPVSEIERGGYGKLTWRW